MPVQLYDVWPQRGQPKEPRIARARVVDRDQRTPPPDLGQRGREPGRVTCCMFGYLDDESGQVALQQGADLRMTQGIGTDVDVQQDVSGHLGAFGDRGPKARRLEVHAAAGRVGDGECLFDCVGGTEPGQGLSCNELARRDVHDGLEHDLHRFELTGCRS